jgi:hypothetical protein
LDHIHFGEALLNIHIFLGNIILEFILEIVHLVFKVKLEIYEFDQIAYEVADLCTSCEGYALQLDLELLI